MKAHITEQEQAINNAIQTNMVKLQRTALASGAKAVSSVIYNMATDETKSDKEKIEDIIKFCRTGLNIKVGTSNDNK